MITIKNNPDKIGRYYGIIKNVHGGDMGIASNAINILNAFGYRRVLDGIFERDRKRAAHIRLTCYR